MTSSYHARVLPTVVFEVRSPEDETVEKLAFYAAVGVDAVVVVERDTTVVQVFSRAGDRYILEAPNPEGWLMMSALEVEVRGDSTHGVGRLTIRLAGEPGSVHIV
jgi:Uma2 family endonuclease